MRVVRFATPLRWSLGLMFRKPAPDTAYLFAFPRDVRYGIHMLFVFSPIDLHFLDAARRVVEVRRGLRPFALHRPRGPYRYLVESRPGLLSQEEGDRLAVD